MKAACKTGSVEKIIEEVRVEFSDCTFIVFGADDKRFEAFVKGLRQALPNAKTIGATGFLIGEQGGVAEGLSLIGFRDDEVEVYVGTLRKAATCPIKYLPGLIWTVDTIHKQYKNSVCLEFCTGNEEKIVSTMKVSLEKVGMRLVGATAGNTQEGQPKKVSCNGKVLTDAVAYAVIGSKIGEIKIMKENMYETHKTGHVVTRVSEDQRTVYEIDGRKAIDVYKEELGYKSSEVERGVFENPLCRIVGDEQYITAIFSFNPDGSITTYKNLQRNDMISFTTIVPEWKEFMRQNMKDLAGRSKIAGLITVNCILRYLYFEQNHYTESYGKMLSEAAGGVHFGIVSDGEQYIEQHVNQSMVCVAFMKER